MIFPKIIEINDKVAHRNKYKISCFLLLRLVSIFQVLRGLTSVIYAMWRAHKVAHLIVCIHMMFTSFTGKLVFLGIAIQNR